MRNILLLLGIIVLAGSTFGQEITQGSLFAYAANGTEFGSVPLKHTKVQTDISGFVARVRVTQEFENTFPVPIEAVYTFPLSQNSAVDEMTMKIGDRIVRGQIMKRDDARKVYESAKSEGKTAALLDQERPNIFTQAVANIMPGEKILIEISYVETLKYEDGSYEFVFPMTVGPRYIPGSVTDVAKIAPPIAESRAGHDISIEVNINAGVPIESIRSTLHAIDQVNLTSNKSKVTLTENTAIPNKDFILKYDVNGRRIEDAIITHRGPNGGFFTMILQPPDKVASEDRTPKEIVFVLDTSGSMYGFPIEKAKEAIKLSLEGLYPNDTFNLITFAGDTHILFDEPVPATRANLDAAQAFLASRQGGGGTEMMKAVVAALKPSASRTHLRIVCFMTDGYIGNEDEIIAEIQKYSNARVFSFGIGNGVNRHLLDKMAHAGKGEVEYVTLEDDGSKAAKRFYERVRTPLLTNISIDWSGMPVADVYPQRIPDLFSSKPVIVHGRYTDASKGVIKLRGTVAGSPYVREIAVDLPESEPRNDSLASLWARTRIDDLTAAAYGEQATEGKIKEADALITQLGLEFRLLTKFTSFVAVEDRVVNYGGETKTVQVPVELADGVQPDSPFRKLETMAALSRPPQVTYVTRSGTGSGSGTGTGTGYASVNGSGSGNGGGGGGLNAVVEVSSSSVATTASSSKIESLPKGTTFSGLLKMEPGFQIDGASGAENTFIIDGAEVTSQRPTARQRSKVISQGVLNGRAASLPKPEYSAAAKAVKAGGTVNVQILIGEDGSVVSARSVSGHALLRAAAEKAALASTFVPTLISGKAVKVSGVIVYNFKNNEARSVKMEKMTTVRTPTDEKALRQAEKLHFWVFAVAERLSKQITEPTPNESKFVKDGRASVEIELSANNAAVIELLKAAGFDTSETEGNFIVGQIPIERIADLAEIEGVRLVLPHY